MTITAEDEVVDFCTDLIRFDTTNYGGECRGERPAAEYVAARLADAGLSPTVVEAAPGRTSVVARLEGKDPGRPALLVHGHLDVVPADVSEWKVHPFAGEHRDACVWGRGAIDMKNTVAAMLAVARAFARESRRPPRDVVLAFVADEEDTAAYGSRWLVDRHAELFDGCAEAVGESGGFSFPVRDDLCLYPIATGERGSAWMRLTARGTAGHGSKVNRDNAVSRLAAALARLSEYDWPVRPTPAVRALLAALAEELEVELDPDALDTAEARETALARLGPAARLVESTLRCSANPTMLAAGYKVNVIPGTATGYIDGRVLPGCEEEFLATLDRLLGPGVTREFVNRENGLESPYDSPLVTAMAEALRAEDPTARPVPYCMAGGTDAKSFARLGIRGYGFSPVWLPGGLDYLGMFHGVDERVPIEGLRFGTRVLGRFLAAC